MNLYNRIVFKYIIPIIILSACTKKSEDKITQSANHNASVSSTTHHLMPVPASFQFLEGKLLLTKDFSIAVSDNAHERLFKAANRFLRRLDGRTGLFFNQAIISKVIPQKTDNPTLNIQVDREGKIALYEDESYTLTINNQKINITAVTDIGAIRALETLLQLLTVGDGEYYFPAIEIKDQPRFPWRGLMIDAARHFQPVDVIKRNLDAMAAVKMNVFHFHLCDNHAWRVESKTYPKLHQLASDGEYYTYEQIKEIINYAADRGIRVIPEFDVPGHATAILVAYPELASAPGPYELERNAGIFDPVLNPTIEQTYVFLDKLFTEMAALFPDPYFHIGGDENNGNHWKSNPDIQAFMKKNNLNTTLELQTYFNNRIIKTITKLNKKMVGWEEILQEGLSKDAIIHSWFGKESLYRAASKGYQTMLSNGYYIDLLHPASDHYSMDPLPPLSEWTEEEKKYTLTPEQEKLILGGEATMWSELVTPLTIDSRIWPRTAAIAERLWSPGSVKDVEDMYRRLEVTSFRLEELGLTHIKNRDVILRNLANGGEVAPLKVLAEVLEPYKVYTRNRGGLMYKSYSPFTLMADATASDAKSARIFNKLVKEYEQNPSAATKAEIEKWLKLWEGNHKAFLDVMKKSPVLNQIEKISEKLSTISTIGLEALKKNKAEEKWYNEKSAIIESVKAETEVKRNSDSTFEDGRTEIMILDAVQTLLDLTNTKAADQRKAALVEKQKKQQSEAEHTEH